MFTPENKIRHNDNNNMQQNYVQKNISIENINKSITYTTVYDLEFVNNMLKKDEEYKINPNYLINHPILKSEYRSILLNWLMELSEEFAFKRDTFHYAARYVDMYLANSKDFSNTQLQLLGIVSLSLSAKIEVNFFI